MAEVDQPMNGQQLQEFITKLMGIQRRYAFEQRGADTRRRTKVKELTIQYAKKTLK
jgi:hypothetical protein